MNRKNFFRGLILIALVVGVVWMFQSQRNSAADKASSTGGAKDSAAETMDASEKPAVSKSRREGPSQADALASIQSPLARRYLRFTLPGARLNGDAYDGSIVNNAFKQAWGVTARLDLTEEQQDRMAEFLLEGDWRNWKTLDARLVDKWAREHLSEGQREKLLAFIEEAKAGDRNLSDLRTEIKKREHAVGTEAEALGAEMKQSKRIAELMAADTDKLSPEEVEKMRVELKELMRSSVAGAGDGEKPASAKALTDEQATQFFHLLADRIPLTEEQQISVYGALRKGVDTASNPYDFSQVPPDRVEQKVRDATRWMGGILTEEQYNTYLRHYLAEIEMIRYQSRP
jgi:hypothetical protein